MGEVRALRTFLGEADRYLAGLEPSLPQITSVRRGMARFGEGEPAMLSPCPEPACGGLDAALASIADAEALRNSIERLGPQLRWITYDSYPAALIGQRFPKAHGFATIIGPEGLLHADDFEFGLFLILPRTLYRDHSHKAPELYAPLTGPHDWRFGIADPWHTRPAHVPVWNEPDAIHATRTGERPFLCLYAWTADVKLPATLVPAPDWGDIEACL